MTGSQLLPCLGSGIPDERYLFIGSKLGDKENRLLTGKDDRRGCRKQGLTGHTHNHGEEASFLHASVSARLAFKSTLVGA